MPQLFLKKEAVLANGYFVSKANPHQDLILNEATSMEYLYTSQYGNNHSVLAFKLNINGDEVNVFYPNETFQFIIPFLNNGVYSGSLVPCSIDTASVVYLLPVENNPKAGTPPKTNKKFYSSLKGQYKAISLAGNSPVLIVIDDMIYSSYSLYTHKSSFESTRIGYESFEFSNSKTVRICYKTPIDQLLSSSAKDISSMSVLDEWELSEEDIAMVKFYATRS